VAKIIDRLLLLIYSVAVIIGLCFLLAAAFNWIPESDTRAFIHNVYTDPNTSVAFITACVVLLLIGIRMFVIAVRTSGGNAPSIDQRTEYGDIRISMETVENLALKAASRSRSVKDLKTRVKITSAGLEIVIRTLVDGETSIPALTEEVQSAVKDHVEEVTGIPVAVVSVYVANIVQSAPTFKSRVE
jgi:uncharacterized alkaline shock family protein YloU